MKGRWSALVKVALVAGIVAAIVLLLAPALRAPNVRPEAAQTVSSGAVLTKKKVDPCARPSRVPFVPTGISVAGVTTGSRVLALGRDSQGVPGVPPVSDKSSFAWDLPGIKPGSPKGNVLLNTHTWPNGAAMGNRLLAGLQEGGRIRLSDGDRHLCYRVTDRVEASVANPPLDRVYDFTGPPQVVIIVCSGVRRGPGDWSHRTIWFASPLAS